MNSPSHDDVARCARELWQNYGQPSGRDLEIWLEAERKLATQASAPADLTPNSTPTQERLKAEMAAESEAEFYISQPVSEQAAIKAALQTKESRTAPVAPVRKSAKAGRTA